MNTRRKVQEKCGVILSGLRLQKWWVWIPILPIPLGSDAYASHYTPLSTVIVSDPFITLLQLRLYIMAARTGKYSKVYVKSTSKRPRKPAFYYQNKPTERAGQPYSDDSGEHA